MAITTAIRRLSHSIPTPKVVRVREDILLDAVHDLFQRRIFGPSSHALLAADLPQSDKQAEEEWGACCRALEKSIAETEANPPARDHQTDLFHEIPMSQTRIAELPEDLQRKLFEAFHVEIRYDDSVGVALIRVTLDHGTIEGLAAMAEHISGNENRRPPIARACAEDLVPLPAVSRGRRIMELPGATSLKISTAPGP
jgi:hypothetical protein